MDEVKTGVDDLMELVAHEGRISIPDAAKKLGQTEVVIQNWVDFLVEEKLLGIEYKFTTPFIYVNSPEKTAAITKKKETFDDEYKEFAARAKQKGMPEDKIPALWQNHLSDAIDQKKEFFVQECQKRSLQADELFKRYKERVLEEHGLRASN